MSDISIRLATKDDAQAVADMLSNLAGEIGSKDQFFSTPETIKQYGFGSKPMFQCFVAEREKPDLGIVLFFPIFSTNRAKPGVYVQDLWASKSARGQGVGLRLLSEVARYSKSEWGADYLSLAVHKDNFNAIAFYKKLGFGAGENDLPMALESDALVLLARC